jgi:tetrahydromethanopterin S-methyltransferase subunit F
MIAQAARLLWIAVGVVCAVLTIGIVIRLYAEVAAKQDAVAGPAPEPPAAPPEPTREERAAQEIRDCDAFADKARAATDAASEIELYQAALGALATAEGDGALVADTKPRRTGIEKKIEALRCPAGLIARSQFGDTLQAEFYKNGMDATVRVSGRCGDRMTIEWALWDGPAVYTFTNGPTPDLVKVAGFRSLRLQGWDRRWDYDW